jgi:hypothetical protein
MHGKVKVKEREKTEVTSTEAAALSIGIRSVHFSSDALGPLRGRLSRSDVFVVQHSVPSKKIADHGRERAITQIQSGHHGIGLLCKSWGTGRGEYTANWYAKNLIGKDAEMTRRFAT